MTLARDLLEVVVAQLADFETSWSVGTFGAIAEFSRDVDEPATIDRHGDKASVVTGRGGIRLKAHDHLRLIASEALTAQSWNQRIALCLPIETSRMSGRSVLTEIGPDADALRHEDRSATLFDLGLGTFQLDACIRVADPAVVTELRPWLGQSLFAPDNGAIATILAANPHRVFLSRLGRVEVFQPIPAPDGKSPDGPHTHILPRLLRHNRTHAATEAIPAGWVPCAHCYPPHPMRDAYGQPRAFQKGRHEAFQGLLDRYGDRQLVDLKRRIAERVVANAPPTSVGIPDDRFARSAVRVALRQLRTSEPAPKGLTAWLACHDHFEPGEQSDATGEHPCTA